MKKLFLVIPCYNEDEVLPITYKSFLEKVRSLVKQQKIDPQSKILFVNDGSTDSSWQIIQGLAKEYPEIIGISQSRNRGHQSTILAGINEAYNLGADAVISTDCDGQDDLDAIDLMVNDFNKGMDVVYGVRDNRDSDSFFKRTTATIFYFMLAKLGAQIVYNHSEYRLMSRQVIRHLLEFKEVNLFLRGLIPLIGFKSSKVYFKRKARVAGTTRYPFKQLMALAISAITSLSIKPIRLILYFGIILIVGSILVDLLLMIDVITQPILSYCFFTLLAGVQLVSLGIIGEYVGKTYLEVKERPRFIISERTFSKNGSD